MPLFPQVQTFRLPGGQGALAASGLCLSLFGFGFLAGLTFDAPWGPAPAVACAIAAALVALPTLRWLRGWGGRAAPAPAWLDALTPGHAHSAALALALAAVACLLAARDWHALALFWPACFALLSAGLTVFGDARSRAADDAEGDDPDDAAEMDDADEAAPLAAPLAPEAAATASA